LAVTQAIATVNHLTGRSVNLHFKKNSDIRALWRSAWAP